MLGMPSLRSCSVGPPPSAIHGRGRLTRHPCRVAHCAEPALGLSRWRTPQQPKRGGLPADLALRSACNPNCGSELARDEAGTFNIDVDCHAAIASKLAHVGSMPVTGFVRAPITCRRWLVGSPHRSEGVHSGIIMSTDPPLSLASQLPQVLRQPSIPSLAPIPGRSWLASEGVLPDEKMLPDPPLSLRCGDPTSQLLQVLHLP